MRKGLNWSVLDPLECGLGTGLGPGQSNWKFRVFIQAGHIDLILGESFYISKFRPVKIGLVQHGILQRALMKDDLMKDSHM